MKIEDKKVLSEQSIMGLYSGGTKQLLVTLCTTKQYIKNLFTESQVATQQTPPIQTTV